LSRVGAWCQLWGKIVWADLRSIRKVDDCTKVIGYIEDKYLPNPMRGINVWMIDPSCFIGASADYVVGWIQTMEARDRLLNKSKQKSDG
jgi:hypothetical protein